MPFHQDSDDILLPIDGVDLRRLVEAEDRAGRVDVAMTGAWDYNAGSESERSKRMENVTYEQALTVVRALPPEDQQRLWQWLEDKQAPTVQPTNGATSPGSFREVEMRWLSEHRREYIELWVALDGDRLLSHNEDLGKVFDEAHAQGVQVPFTAFIEDPDQSSVAGMGGW